MLQKFGRHKTAVGQVVVNYSICHFCGACVGACPENAIQLYSSHLVIEMHECTTCERCIRACPLGALSMADDRLEPAS